MTQQQAAAGAGAQSLLRTEHQEDCAALARPTPSRRPPYPALPCKAQTANAAAGPCNYFERLVTAGWGVGSASGFASGHKYSRKFLSGLELVAFWA
jgi:hypothetical protein